MSQETDALFGLVTLGAFAGALVAVDAPLSIPFFALGGAGTIAFEVVASRRTEPVHRYWQWPPVQIATLLLTFVIVGLGATVAPSSVLSAGIGALLTYLILLVVVLVRTGR